MRGEDRATAVAFGAAVSTWLLSGPPRHGPLRHDRSVDRGGGEEEEEPMK